MMGSRPGAGEGGTRSWPFARRSAALALFASLVTANFDLSLFAEGSFFEGQRQIGAGVSATLCPAAPSTTAAHVHAEEVAEDVAENVAEVGEVRGIKPAESSAAIHRGMTVLVIACALVRIHQDA